VQSSCEIGDEPSGSIWSVLTTGGLSSGAQLHGVS
jgi:hypothetical protein